MAEPYNLTPLKRFITGQDANGKAVFLKQVDPELSHKELDHLPQGGSWAPKVALAYATDSFPVNLDSEKDVRSYERYLTNQPGLTIKGGTVFRFVDFPPGGHAPMHRTQSLDYGVVLEGSVTAGLDSGETQILHRGDSVIQRATNHDWANASETQWARMLFVLCDAEGR